MANLEVYQGFNPYYIKDFFQQRGWQKVELISVGNVDLVPTDPNSALECGDGRFDKLPKRKKHGPRVFGQLNAFSALITGGTISGFQRAATLVRSLGYSPGTHGAVHIGEGCGLFGLWRSGRLQSAVHGYGLSLEVIEMQGVGRKQSEWIKALIESLGGKHFTLPGEHNEEALRYNPFAGMTEVGISGDRFKVDDWLLAAASMPLDRRLLFNAETVEQLKPDATRLEIIVP